MSRLLPIELKEFDATALTGANQNFGSVLLNPAIKISIFNTSNQDCYVTANIVVGLLLRVPANGTLTLDESTLYFRGVDQEYYIPRGTQLQLRRLTTTATSGNVIAHVVTRQSP